MTDQISNNQLRKLVQSRNGPCVTIYMPTINKSGRQILGLAIELKNLAKTAAQKLSGHWMSEAAAMKFLDPVLQLAEDSNFWHKSDQGLALFLGGEVMHKWQVAVPFDSQVYVSNRFFVRPMLPAIDMDEFYYILSICQNKVELFEASEFEIERISVPGMPLDIESTLNLTDTGRVTQIHMGSREFGGKQSSIYHGHGGKRDTSKKEIEQYYRAINQAVTHHLHDSRQPMILACVADDASIYQKVNTYPKLLEWVAKGSTDRMSDKQILAQALPGIREYNKRVRQLAIDSFRDNADTHRTLAEIAAIVSAAHVGQIDKLFVNPAARLPGEFNPGDQSIDYQASTKDFDKDLIEEAISETLLHRGSVYSLSENEMPARTELAAVLRY